MKETHELALVVKSVTNTGFIQLKPLHSLIRKSGLSGFILEGWQVSQLGQLHAQSSSLGVILLPPFSKPQGLILQRSCQVPGVTFRSVGLSTAVDITCFGLVQKVTARSTI